MLRQVAEGVLIQQSEFCQSNAIVVHGRDGVLLIDAGVLENEMAALADDLREMGQPVVAGFSTHPHWDHLLWHAGLGGAPRYGTARCAATARDRLSDPGAKARVAALIPPDLVGQVPLDLLGLITGLPGGTARIPWDGPQVRIIEHQAHAPGHAALLIEERGVLVAGDMLSDVLIPMLDLNGTAEQTRYTHGSTRTGGTCTPCVTPAFPPTRGSAHWPHTTGCLACTHGSSRRLPRHSREQ